MEQIAKKVWYRHRSDGQRGYLVTVDGVQHMRLDRPSQNIDVPYNPNQWDLVHETRTLNRWHTAKIAFVADRELCAALGLFELARQDWHTLTDKQRMDWEASGPGSISKLRQELFEDIMGRLKPHTTR